MPPALTLEVASGPQNLAKFGISHDVIDRLHGFDLSDRVYDAKIICGSGGYADVSRGELKPSGNDGATTLIAIKRMRFHLRDDIIGLFEKEIYVWSKFKHENVARLLGYAFDSYGYPLLVSEWMENGNAWDFVNRNRNFDVLPLVVGIAKGLNYLHEEMDAAHSDIKGVGPVSTISKVYADLEKRNVLVSSSDPPRAVICDMGMSRIVNASLSLGRPSPTITGTIRWLAYEAFFVDEKGVQGNSDFAYTKKMDVWSFGMTVYELHSRKFPYDKCRSEIQATLAITSRELPQFDDTMSDKHGELFNQICQECWKFDPGERASVLSVLDLLSENV